MEVPVPQIPFNYIIIVLGAILGSLKSSLDTKDDIGSVKKAINFLLGIYFGISISLSYINTLEIGFLGLIAVTGAMVGTNILEVVSDLTPDIVKKLIKDKFK